MKKYLIKKLFNYLLPDRMLPEITLRKRFTVLEQMRQNVDIVDLLRSEYTREYKTIVNSWFLEKNRSDEFVRGFYTGRLFKLNELINDIVTAEGKLDELERFEEKQNVFNKSIKKERTNLIKDPF